MLKNYFKIAFRNLRKRKGFTFINVLSLTLGIIGGVFMLIYSIDELSFDQFHQKKDRIYRVNTVFTDSKTGSESHNSNNGWPVGKILEEEFSQVEQQIYISTWPKLEVTLDKKNFQQNMIYADKDMFDIFSFEMIKGNPEKALTQPFQVVITEDMQEKFFPGEDALDQILLFADTLPMKVTGVVKNIPQNSHIQFDMMVSFATFESLVSDFGDEEGWGNINMTNYLLLREGADFEAFKSKATNIYMDRVGDMMKSWGTKANLAFEPLGDIYLKSRTGNGLGPQGSIDRVYLVLGICLFTIILACINFINLSTARSVDRSKEVGLRKVVGSSRFALISQFLTEALLLTLISFLFALVIATFLLPFFNELLNKNYSLKVLLEPQIILGIIILLFTIAFLAGYYPALNLSSLQPIRVLKGKFTGTKSGVQLRKILVVFQFFISISLVLGTFLVLDQLEYMQKKDLGFVKDEILVVNASKVPKSSMASFKQELQNLPGIKEISYSNGIPGRPGWIGQIAFPEGREEQNPASVEYLAVDESYIDVLGLEVIAGRNFDPNRETDLSEGLVLNESAVTLFGWNSPEESLGKRIVSPSGTPEGTVIGVVKNFHQRGLQRKIHGIAMDAAPEYAYHLVVRFDVAQTSEVISQMNELWLKFFPENDYSYFFLNEDFERLYQAETRLSKVFGLFAGLTLLISVIGLLGLVAFMIESRSKELSIRKVLGASVMSIIGMISKEFLLLVGIAGILSIPVVWHFGRGWLENFAYRTTLDPMIFVVAIFLALTITMLTVALQSLKAAKSNTTKALNGD